MPTVKRKVDYFETEEGKEIVAALKQMAADEAYNTDASYSANVASYPDHKIPFVDKHMEYLLKNPNMNPRQYISNLQLMTRIKTARV